MKETKNRNEMRRRKMKGEKTRQGIKEGNETGSNTRKRKKMGWGWKEWKKERRAG